MIDSTSKIVLVAGEVPLSAAQTAALAHLPLHVMHAATLGAAVGLLVARRPAVVLVSVRAPATAVKTVAQQIQQADLPTRIIVLAEHPTVRGAKIALQAGAVDYLGSGVGGARLAASVRRAVAAVPANPPRALSPSPAPQALRDKDDLISLVSHELRTPLMAINGYLEILQKYQAKLTPEKTRDFIERSLQATSELAYLSDMLVQVLQFEAGQLAPRFSAVALAPLAHAAIEQCDLLLAGRTITEAIAPDLVVRADAMALQQILRNLLSNAIKYSPQGGTITLSAQRAGEMIAIAVRDEGIGIAPERLPHLFQRFARVHDVGQWPAIRGTGLGLYICRQLVTAHGGQIWAESTPGQGSTFHLHLPSSPSTSKSFPPPLGMGHPAEKRQNPDVM
jgi:signal transduction histidine kinase